MVEVYLHLLPKVQLHILAFDNSQLKVVHESLESSYTRFNMDCEQWGCGRWGGHDIWWVDGLCTVGMWEMRWARHLVGGWAVYSGDVGDEEVTRTDG